MLNTLGDQIVSEDLYRDAFLLSHLARSIFQASCAAVTARQGRPSRMTPSSCAVDPQFMQEYGDQDTMEMLGRLYRRVATEIGSPEEADRRIEQLIPATAAGLAFDLVGMISGAAPSAKLIGGKFSNPAMIDYLKGEPGACPKPSKLFFVVGALGIVAGGIGVGWALSKA